MSTITPSKPRFTLHLEVQPRPGDDPDGMRRLRAVLKLLLRCFGFRCTRIEYPADSIEKRMPQPSDPVHTENDQVGQPVATTHPHGS